VEERVEVTEDTQIWTTAASHVETIKKKLHQIWKHSPVPKCDANQIYFGK
jgi:hypothetical protein